MSHLVESRTEPAAPRVPHIHYTPRRLFDTVVRTRTLGLFDEFARHADRAVEMNLFGERAWVLTDPELCRQALSEPAHVVTRSARYRKISILLGNSLLTTDGAEHRRRRRLIQPAFHQHHVGAYAPAILAAAAETDRLWRPGATVDMGREMAALTLHAIGAAVLGIDGRGEAVTVGPMLDRIQRAIALTLLPGGERVMRSRLPVLRELGRAQQALQAVAGRAARADTELVEVLRRPGDDRTGLSDDDVRDELLTLLLAGHETTAMTLTWAWLLLHRHPAVADRLRAEHEQVLGGSEPSYDDVERLPFTSAVVAETLRLRPAAWIVERQVVGDLDLGGLRPPAGTVLLVSPWLLHRDPSSWERPEQFRPQRWLTAGGRYDDAAPGHPRGAYLPFGAGAHVCVGASFAWTESVLALAVLARRWRPAPVDGGEMPLRATATLRPARPVRMRLDPAA